MKQPKKPTLAQKKIIAGAGMDPEKWSVRFEGRKYLHIVDRGIEQRSCKLLTRGQGELLKDHLEAKRANKSVPGFKGNHQDTK